MKTFLIETQPNKFILCSDEEIKIGDWYSSDLGINKLGETTRNVEQYRNKIIAGYSNLPKISFTDEVAKEIGYIDVDYSKLCFYDTRNSDFLVKEEFGYDKEEVDACGEFSKKRCSCDNCFYGRSKLTEQLIKTLELIQRRYTEADLKKAIEMAKLIEEENRGKKEEFEIEGLMGLTEICTHGMDVKYTSEQIIQSLQQPRMWEVEIFFIKEENIYKITKIY